RVHRGPHRQAKRPAAARGHAAAARPAERRARSPLVERGCHPEVDPVAARLTQFARSLRPALAPAARTFPRPAALVIIRASHHHPSGVLMKATVTPALTGLAAFFLAAAAAAQPAAPAAPQPFRVGTPLGATNEAGQAVTMSSNVKVDRKSVV